MFRKPPLSRALLLSSFLLLPSLATASSHREAPFIAETPKVDGTDFYMFNSYESGRNDFVTLIANYVPLQDAYGGPNYFTMDPDAIYEIKIDNSGDAKEDLTFRFQFRNFLKDIQLNIGPAGNQKRVSVPVVNVGAVGPTLANLGNLNVIEGYSVSVIRGSTNSKRLNSQAITNVGNNSTVFIKPLDNVGTKSIPDYEAYARNHIYNVNIPGCSVPGRMFVGQRRDPFVVNLGETFDLVNIANPVGSPSAEQNTIADKNVTSLILEVAKSCLTKGSDPVIAGWTTASLHSGRLLSSAVSFGTPERTTGNFVQVSRLANPLVNELVIGIKDKDKFNRSRPSEDAQFADYVTHPTLPAILELLFGSAGVQAPTKFPRTDLVSVFLTGVDGLNKTNATAELMRLNTSISAIDSASQNRLGVLGGDNAGYPNGRRPGDDVVDISLRAAMGVLLSTSDAPSGQLPFTDGAIISATDYGSTFPYLNSPLGGSPDPASTN